VNQKFCSSTWSTMD